ncbi:MAG: FHA domain-containing protein [Planctomycetota bacterium]
MAKLLIERNGASRIESEITPDTTTTIGRLKGCSVQLEDPQISRVHALITFAGGAYTLTDQGSMNGTQVNGKKLERGAAVTLKDGDTVGIQAFTLRFCADGSSLSAASPPPIPSPSTAIPPEFEQPPEPCVLLSHLLEGGAEREIWTKGELTLRVADIIEETWDTKTFRLVGASNTLFSYKPGQFVTMTVPIDGKPVNRSYSISSSPSRPHTLELTIKRVPGGLVSNWMNDRVSLGDEIKVRGPAGRFSCFNYPSRKMLCIAGGSGITPIMSMLRWIVDTAADVDVVLLYSGKSPSDFIFKKELETISARHNGLRVLFTVTSSWSGTDSWTGLTGRCTDRMIELVAPDVLERHVFLCGPKPFSDAMKEQLRCLDYPMANLHSESFGEGRVATGTPQTASRPQPAPAPAPASAAASAPPAAAPPVPAETPQAAPVPPPAQEAAPVEVSAAAAVAAGHKVTFQTSGVEAVYGEDGDSLLDFAEVHGVEIDYACRQGSCGCCRTKCISGEVEMEDSCLSDEERSEGWIYPCVARAKSDVVLGA